VVKKPKGERLNPKSPLTEQIQRGMAICIDREMNADAAFRATPNPKTLKRRERARASRAAGTKRLVEQMREGRAKKT
jgi:hypothetical protein